MREWYEEAKETKLDYGSGSSQPENFIVFLGAHLHPRFSSLPPPQCAVASSWTSAETSGSSVKTGKVAVRDSLSALVCWLWRWTLARPRAVILTLPPAFNKEELTQPAERRRHELKDSLTVQGRKTSTIPQLTVKDQQVRCSFTPRSPGTTVNSRKCKPGNCSIYRLYSRPNDVRKRWTISISVIVTMVPN